MIIAKMKKELIIGIVIVLVLVVGGLFLFQSPEDSFSDDSDFNEEDSSQNSDKFIVANPIDLDEIAFISQFRSCMGHDFSGINTDGEKETNRSMKHYVTQKNGIESAKAFAPFNGQIVMAVETQIGKGMNVYIEADDASGWVFIFYHIDLEQGLKERSRVTAGEIMGHSAVLKSNNFDFALKTFERVGQIFETPFYHMTDEVLAEYEKRGLTAENIVIPKEQRDASPCNYSQDSGRGSDEQVILQITQ